MNHNVNAHYCRNPLGQFCTDSSYYDTYSVTGVLFFGWSALSAFYIVFYIVG